ncbi:MAG: hypothetical protein IID30_01890 [Planctomycetes bacterium]|nr:hypothetical protein [Planctomycetota bacterium]MCH7602392.1 hypothetical protein [Planctomycetota bacterium]
MSDKEFDCVEMKRRIQEKLLEEWGDRDPEEIRRHEDQKIRRNPILARFWRELPKSKAS